MIPMQVRIVMFVAVCVAVGLLYIRDRRRREEIAKLQAALAELQAHVFRRTASDDLLDEVHERHRRPPLATVIPIAWAASQIRRHPVASVAALGAAGTIAAALLLSGPTGDDVAVPSTRPRHETTTTTKLQAPSVPTSVDLDRPPEPEVDTTAPPVTTPADSSGGEVSPAPPAGDASPPAPTSTSTTAPTTPPTTQPEPPGEPPSPEPSTPSPPVEPVLALVVEVLGLEVVLDVSAGGADGGPALHLPDGDEVLAELVVVGRPLPDLDEAGFVGVGHVRWCL